MSEVHSLINTSWGQRGPRSYVLLEFFGSSGAYFKKELVGNVDIRDWNRAGWTNLINGTSTINVVALGGGQHRLDKQRTVLPEAFRTQMLVNIRMSDTGRSNFQRAFLAGVTVSVKGN